MGLDVEELKRVHLVVPGPGEKFEDVKRKLWEDLEVDDRLNREMTTTYTFGRGDGGWFEVPKADAAAEGKVALMFLTMGAHKNDAWWQKWLDHATAAGHEGHFNIYYHRGGAYGQEGDSISDDFFATRGKPILPATKTGWARSGLVRASLMLMRLALEDPANKWFILLSDGCMPLYTFSDLYEKLGRETVSRFNDFGMTVDGWLSRNIWQDGVCTNARRSHKADQWAMWVRDDAEWFVRENHLLKLKPLSVFMDEPYFINMMDEHKRPYKNIPTVYTKWWDLDDAPGRAKGNSLKKMFSSPHVFPKVTLKRLRTARGGGAWFMRKLSPGGQYPTLEELQALGPDASQGSCFACRSARKASS